MQFVIIYISKYKYDYKWYFIIKDSNYDYRTIKTQLTIQ